MKKTHTHRLLTIYRWRCCGLLAGMVLALVGCSNDPPEPLRAGILIWPAYEMAYLADDLGYYQGGDIEIVGFQSPAESLRAYNSGAIDAVAMTTNYMLQVAARNPSQRIIQLINVSDGADVLMAKPEIESLDALKGKRIGVERSALGAYMLQRILDTCGLRTEDIVLVSVEVSEGPEYYTEDLIDALITYEPFKTRLLNLGAHELFSSRELPNEIMDVLFARQEVIDGRPGDLAVLVDGWLRAVETYQSDPEKYAPPMADREKLTTEEFIQTFEEIKLTGREFNREMLVEKTDTLADKLEMEADVLRRAGFLDVDFDYPSLLDGRFIEALTE